MRLEARKYLHDIQRALDEEALNQLARRDESLAARISDFRRIIAFRNILIHGYTDIDDRLVRDIIETKLPTLRGEISELLREGGNPDNR